MGMMFRDLVIRSLGDDRWGVTEIEVSRKGIRSVVEEEAILSDDSIGEYIVNRQKTLSDEGVRSAFDVKVVSIDSHSLVMLAKSISRHQMMLDIIINHERSSNESH